MMKSQSESVQGGTMLGFNLSIRQGSQHRTSTKSLWRPKLLPPKLVKRSMIQSRHPRKQKIPRETRKLPIPQKQMGLRKNKNRLLRKISGKQKKMTFLTKIRQKQKMKKLSLRMRTSLKSLLQLERKFSQLSKAAEKTPIVIGSPGSQFHTRHYVLLSH